DSELGRLVESTVWVNEAHPAYRRAAASRSEGYHTALAVALALAPLAVDPAKEHAFITAFLASWGAAIERRKGHTRRSARPAAVAMPAGAGRRWRRNAKEWIPKRERAILPACRESIFPCPVSRSR